MTKKKSEETSTDQAKENEKLTVEFNADVVGVEMCPTSCETAYVLIEREGGDKIKILVDIDVARAYGAQLFRSVTIRMELNE